MSPSLTILGRADETPMPAGYIPIFEAPASCGWPSPADDYIQGQINLHEVCVRNPAETFFLKASGDSMTGVGIHNDDLLVVDRSLDAVRARLLSRPWMTSCWSRSWCGAGARFCLCRPIQIIL